jgi:beta-glucosidase
VSRYEFPDGFIWGAATSAYQIEGSPLADGAGASIQHRFAHTPGNSYRGETGDVAADHYHRYRQDVGLMREVGLQTYQFSFAWPRILPEGTRRLNQAGLDFYDRLIEALLEAGVAPAPILHVWDYPAALQDRGGWANRDSAGWFAEYAQVIFERYGDRAETWFTICEPLVVSFVGYVDGAVAPRMHDLFAGTRAAHHVQLAHGLTVQAFRASGARGAIGTSTVVSDVVPASAGDADVAAADRLWSFMNGMFLDPVLQGRYPQDVIDRLGAAAPPVEDGDMDVIAEPIDFLGITYYMGHVASALRNGGPEDGLGATDRLLEVRHEFVPGRRTALDWPVHPEGLYKVLVELRDRYGNPPIIITETGGAYDDVITDDGRIEDVERTAFLREHLVEAHRAIQDGVDLRGFFAWAFLDTWEFWLGFRGRFGLVHIDYGTLERTVKDSAYWYRDVMATNGFEPEPSGATAAS